jgi:hypothetical protein
MPRSRKWSFHLNISPASSGYMFNYASLHSSCKSSVVARVFAQGSDDISLTFFKALRAVLGVQKEGES